MQFMHDRTYLRATQTFGYLIFDKNCDFSEFIVKTKDSTRPKKGPIEHVIGRIQKSYLFPS